MTIWLLIPLICTHIESHQFNNSFESTSCSKGTTFDFYESKQACEAHNVPHDAMTDMAGQVNHVTYECVPMEVKKS